MAAPEGEPLAPHPEPPAALHDLDLPLAELPGPFAQLHRCDAAPLYFGCSGDQRFDAPDCAYDILYAGMDEYCTFIEVFGDVRGLTGLLALRPHQVADRCLARIEAKRPLRLVDLTGSGLARLGADARLCTGDYRVAQRWARALWEHPLQPDGLYYVSRHDPDRRSVALFGDRVAGEITPTSRGSLGEKHNRRLLADLLDHYRVAWIAGP